MSESEVRELLARALSAGGAVARTMTMLRVREQCLHGGLSRWLCVFKNLDSFTLINC